MRIQEIISQHRRDFRAIYECDHDDCDSSKDGTGYDDSFFHQQVSPAMKCDECGRTADADTRKLAPLHNDGVML